MKSGKLYGIGVGPGDPELLSLKAVRILGEVDMVFTAASTKNDYSLAVEIVRPHIPADMPVEQLGFPMSKDRDALEAAWRRNASRIAEKLEAGLNAAFLTLGDPLTYSTFGYILRHLQNGWPHLSITTVPGITSYQAAAAATNQILVEGEETLMIMSGVHGGERLQRLTEKPDNAVFLKAYRNVDGICHALKEADMLESSVAVANCSRADETIYPDLSVLGQRPPNYWTLIIAKHRQNGFKKRS